MTEFQPVDGNTVAEFKPAEGNTVAEFQPLKDWLDGQTSDEAWQNRSTASRGNITVCMLRQCCFEVSGYCGWCAVCRRLWYGMLMVVKEIDWKVNMLDSGLRTFAIRIVLKPCLNDCDWLRWVVNVELTVTFKRSMSVARCHATESRRWVDPWA